MAIHSILNENDGANVMFRNRETTTWWTQPSEIHDVFLATMDHHVYPANARPRVPWARSKAEHDAGHHFQILADRPGNAPHVYTVWEHDGHIRASTTGWSAPTNANRIFGDSSAQGTKVLVIDPNGVLWARNVGEAALVEPAGISVEAAAVEPAGIVQEHRLWFFLRYGNNEKQQMTSWYLSGRPIFGGVVNPSWHGRPMRLVPVERGPHSAVLLADTHDGTDYYMSLERVRLPYSGHSFALTTDRSQAARLHPRLAGNTIYFLLDPAQGGGAMTISTSLGDMSFEPLQEANGIPFRQYFEFEAVVASPRYYIVHDESRQVMLPYAPSAGALIRPVPRADRVPTQLWSVEGETIVHAESELVLDVDNDSRLCLAAKEPGRPSQRWSIDHGYLTNAANGLVATLEGEGPIAARPIIRPTSPAQLWHLEPKLP